MANQPRTSSTVRPQVRTVGSVRKVEVSRLGSAAGPTGGRGAPSSDAQVERLCTAAVQAVAARARQLTTAQPGWPWAEILGTTDRPSHAGAAAATPGAAVLANLAALAAAPTVADYAILTELLEHLGGRELARLQHQRATPVEPDDSLPIASLFTLALSPAVYAPIFEAAGQQVSDDLRDRCAEVSLRLMLQDMPAGPPDPPLTTVEDFLRCFELETLPGWRRHLVRYALDPWSPYTHQLLDLAEQTGNPAYVTGIQAFLTALRSEVEDRDRQSVAAEIRRLIASTNCTQGQFARRVGTSASRISTYATGAVTPGASMFLRIRRTAERLVAEQAAADHQLAARARGGAAGAPSRPFPPYGHLGGGGPRAGERRAGSLS